jgi:excisionase family DNA binding protein
MGKTNTRETTVDEAAQELGVTARSVLNYIKTREIEALKVGKSWFINKASLDAFKQKHGFASKVDTSVGISEKETISESFPKNSEKPEKISKPRNPELKKEKREIYPVHSLRLFQIAHETL